MVKIDVIEENGGDTCFYHTMCRLISTKHKFITESLRRRIFHMHIFAF